MSKIKDLLLTILEEYQQGISVREIADRHGMTIEGVREIIETYSY